MFHCKNISYIKMCAQSLNKTQLMFLMVYILLISEASMVYANCIKQNGLYQDKLIMVVSTEEKLQVISLSLQAID